MGNCCGDSGKNTQNITYNEGRAGSARGLVTSTTEHELLYLDNIWCCCTRPEGKANILSEELSLFQPEMSDIPDTKEQTRRSALGDKEYDKIANRRTCESDEIPMGTWRGAKHISDIREWKVGDDFVPEFPRGKKVIIFVHGFTVRYPAALDKLRFIAEALGESLTIIGFVWPGTFKAKLKTAKIFGYIHSRDLAERSAERLRKLIKVVAGHENEVHLLGHSMGARLVLQALHNYPPKELGKTPKVGHTFLIAAAVPVVSLDDGDQFPASSLGTEQLTVFHSVKDDVLPMQYKLGEFIPGLLQARHSPGAQLQALGMTGPSAAVLSSKNCNVTGIDVSDEVDCHHTTSWMSSKTIQKVICESLSLAEWTSEKWISRGLSAEEKETHLDMVSTLACMGPREESNLDSVGQSIGEDILIAD